MENNYEINQLYTVKGDLAYESSHFANHLPEANFALDILVGVKKREITPRY